MRSVDDYLTATAAPATSRHPYGDGPDQFADLYLPPGAGPHPVVVAIHGGCWRSSYGLSPFGPVCVALQELGLAVWNVEYRRLGSGGGWPHTFRDVGAAIDHLRQIPASLDLSRLVALGHSAGGHLALWAAARSRLSPAHELWSADALPVVGVVALAAIADLAAAAREGLCGSAVVELMGGGQWSAERLAQASPAHLLPLGVTHRHVVGELDRTVPSDHVVRFVDAARNAGDDARATVLDGVGHFEVVWPGSQAWDGVREALVEVMGDILSG